MTHSDEGHYAAKHPAGTNADETVRQAVRDRVQDGRLSCRAAHRIAAELEAAPAAVGIALDLMECRIERCQMGLFGYRPEKRVVQPAEEVPPRLSDRILRARGENGKISCLECWNIAAELDLPRMAVSAACERLSVKIGPCQLGAF